MTFAIRLLVSRLRCQLLKNILYLAGFKIVREHWVYVKELKSGSIVVDLGANTGTFSQAMFKNYHCKCFAIEPNIELFDRLDTTFLSKYNYAVTKGDGPVSFYISENHEASSLHNNFQNLWKEKAKRTVEGISWNSLLRKLHLETADVDVLKMDVEGAELEIINSLTWDNSKKIKQITAEFHHKLNPELHNETKQAIKKLLLSGFICISNSISPTEILFLRDKDFKFNPYQLLLLRLYKKLRFSPYE